MGALRFRQSDTRYIFVDDIFSTSIARTSRSRMASLLYYRSSFALRTMTSNVPAVLNNDRYGTPSPNSCISRDEVAGRCADRGEKTHFKLNSLTSLC